jgi:excisionase family DNA binding protein
MSPSANREDLKMLSERERNPPRNINARGQLLTPQECAEFLQIEVNTLYVMRSHGRIPYRKVGHLLRFDFDEIVEWTKKGKN